MSLPCLSWAEPSWAQYCKTGITGHPQCARETEHWLSCEPFPTGETSLVPRSLRGSSLMLSDYQQPPNARNIILGALMMLHLSSQSLGFNCILILKCPELSLPRASSSKTRVPPAPCWVLFPNCSSDLIFGLNLQSSPRSSQYCVPDPWGQSSVAICICWGVLSCHVVLQDLRCQLCTLSAFELVSECDAAHQNWVENRYMKPSLGYLFYGYSDHLHLIIWLYWTSRRLYEN